jgi:hypothetical protein
VSAEVDAAHGFSKVQRFSGYLGKHEEVRVKSNKLLFIFCGALVVLCAVIGIKAAQRSAPAESSANAQAQYPSRTDFRHYGGKYRGFSPTDAAAIGMGEIELVIQEDKANIRFATGSKIIEDSISLSDFVPMSTAELDAMMKGTDMPSTEGFVYGFKPKTQPFPIFLFASEKKGGECEQLLIRMGATDLIGPTILFSPMAVARGDFDKAIRAAEQMYWPGVVPSLKSGGKAAPKPGAK